MYFVYVLLSEKDNKFYTGFTVNLERRVAEHNNGNEVSTKGRRPFRLVYYEWSVAKEDAVAREKFLKTGQGKRYIKNRIKHDLLVCRKVL